MGKKKYPMMVTIKEASQIYQQRVKKERQKQGYFPLQKPVGEPQHTTVKKIQKAVTLTLLRNEKIT
jgi:hypothetical protein